MNEIPYIRIEIEGLKRNIAHMFSANNEEFNDYIISEIEKTLSEEWVKDKINQSVKSCISKAIDNVADNWRLQNAITGIVGESIEKLIKGNQHLEDQPLKSK